ncbi:hypothetical protein A9Q74_00080 [Colwellia sp. 39_35_sub15_T18]|nr:hypothetical protein A9Q74_00080 [Colwellia sp. 39_35_sub15_T18]
MKTGRYSFIALSICASLSAHAKDDFKSQDVKDIERIIVTGSRSNAALEDLAISVSLVNETELTKQLRFDTNIVRSLEFTVPGISIQGTDRSGCSTNIRGRSTSFQINGAPVNDDLRKNSCNGAFLISPFAIESIEAVRGGTALYGAGAPGGIVNLITRRAKNEELEVDLTAQTSFATNSSNDSFVTDLYAGAGQKFERVDYYFGAGYRDSDLSKTPDGGLVPGTAFDAYNINGSLGFDFSENGKLEFFGTFYKENKQETASLDGNQVKGEEFGKIVIPSIHPDGDSAFDQLTTLTVTYSNADFLGHSVSVSAFYQDTKIQQRVNFYDVNDGGDFFFATNIDNERLGFRSALVKNLKLDGADLILSYGLDFTHNSIYRPKIDTDSNDEVVNFIAPETILRTSALFALGEYEKGDWRFSVGARQEWYTGEVGDRDFSADIPNAGTPGDFSDSDLILWNAGAVYKLTDLSQLFFGFSQGAEISQIGRATRGVSDPSTISPEPAASDQYEVGVRGVYNGIRFEAAAFYSESERAALLQLDPTCAGEKICTLIPLRAPQEIYGIDGSISWSAADNLDVSALITWQRGSISEEDGSNKLSLASDTVVPLRLTTALDWYPMEKLAVGLQATYYGEGDFFSAEEVNNGAANTDSQFLLNTNVSYQLAGGELYLAISNLLNDEYVNISEQAGGDFTYYITEGRRATLGYKIKF